MAAAAFPSNSTGEDFACHRKRNARRAAFFASRVRDLAPSPTLAVSDRARQLKAQGIDVIDLGGGDPDFITPEHIRARRDRGDERRRHALRRQRRHSRLCARRSPTSFAPTMGSRSTPTAASSSPRAESKRSSKPTLAFVEPGVDVLIPEPAWVSYGPMVELAGGTPFPVPLDPDDNWRLTREALAAAWTPATRILLINSPNNPTGRVLDDAELAAIATFAQRPRSPRLLRRDVREDPLRRTATHQHRHAAWHGGAHAHLQRSLEGLRHDGLAPRLRGRSAAVSSSRSRRCTATPSRAPRRSCRRPASSR